jgi:hypothetical protein
MSFLQTFRRCRNGKVKLDEPHLLRQGVVGVLLLLLTVSAAFLSDNHFQPFQDDAYQL